MNTTQPDFYLLGSGFYVPLTGNSEMDKFREYGRSSDSGRTIIYGSNTVRGFVVFEDIEIVDDRIYGNLINGCYLDRFFNALGRERLFYEIPGTETGLDGITPAQLQFTLLSEQYQPGVHAVERHYGGTQDDGAGFDSTGSLTSHYYPSSSGVLTSSSMNDWLKTAIASYNSSGGASVNAGLVPQSGNQEGTYAYQSYLNSSFNPGQVNFTDIVYNNIYVNPNTEEFATGREYAISGVWLNRVVALASHSVTSVEPLLNNTVQDVKEGGAIVGSRNLLSIYRHLDLTSPRSPSHILCLKSWKPGRWCPKATLEGIPYVHLRCRWDGLKFLDSCYFKVVGKDDIDTSFDTLSSEWTDNPAAILYDYLSDSTVGLSVSTSYIDSASFTTAAGICDQSVDLNAGGTETRYRCNAVLSTTDGELSNLDKILNSFAGKLFLDNGKFKVRAGAWTSSAASLTQDDIVSSLRVFDSTSAQELYNGIGGVFVSESLNYAIAPYPSYVDSTYKTEDGEKTKLFRFDCPFTPSSSAAQRLARIWLNDHRQTLSVEFTGKLDLLHLSPGDIVDLTLDQYGWSSKTFMIISSEVDLNSPGVKFLLKSHSSDIYDWDESTDEMTFSVDESEDVPEPTSVSWNNTSKTLTWSVPGTADDEWMVQIQHNGYASASEGNSGENTVVMASDTFVDDLDDLHNVFGVYVRAGEESYSASRWGDTSGKITPTKVRLRFINDKGHVSDWVNALP